MEVMVTGEIENVIVKEKKVPQWYLDREEFNWEFDVIWEVGEN